MITKGVDVNYKNIEWLEAEFEEAVKNHFTWHGNMELYTDYRNNNAFYAPKSGTIRNQTSLSINLLRMFSDKNVYHMNKVPDVAVPPLSPNDFERDKASKREKAVLAAFMDNNMRLKQGKWAEDATDRSAAFVRTTFDHKKRRPVIERIEPRYCYYQRANDNDSKMVAFWTAYPMTKDQIKREYGVTPTHSNIDPASFTKQALSRIDGKDWYMVVTRDDDEVTVSWVGDKFIQKAHKHQLGTLPVDMAAPLSTGNLDGFPDFFLRDLVSPQAEFNETMRKMANIVRKLGNPAVWGRGIVARQHEDVKRALRGDGGFVGLKGDGELGILQVPETAMLDNHLDRLFAFMKYLSGFSNSSFGDPVGANTSGDAVNMYGQPTEKAISHQNIAWKSMYESVASKVLRYYDTFLKTDESITLTGFAPTSTTIGTMASKGRKAGQGTNFNTVLTKGDIDGNYVVIATPQAITPKDEISYKRLVYEAVSGGFISKTTGYEEWGILSPQDELELLKVEQADEDLNPEGAQQRASAASSLASVPEGGADGVPVAEPTTKGAAKK